MIGCRMISGVDHSRQDEDEENYIKNDEQTQEEERKNRTMLHNYMDTSRT